jgi:enoyl-CoA hydratase/carnithine racemase
MDFFLQYFVHHMVENSRERKMTQTSDYGAIDRRSLLTASSATAAALAMGLASTDRVFAQANPAVAPAAQPPAAGKVTLERLPGGILLIGMDRQQTRNRLDPPVLIGVGKALYELDHDDTLRVGVLHGVGPDFMTGLDLPAFTAAVAAGVLPPKDPDFINPVGIAQQRVKPLVVAVQGATNTAGHEMFLAADVRIASSDSVFGQFEVANALFPAGGATVRFTREAGWGNAMRYMLTGDKWNAAEAYRMGLVQEITPPGKQLERAIEIAKKIASMGPLGVQATLASAHQAIASDEAVFKTLQPEFRRLQQTDDAREARAALQQNRSPVYQGR